jgi:hypothetical protein
MEELKSSPPSGAAFSKWILERQGQLPAIGFVSNDIARVRASKDGQISSELSAFCRAGTRNFAFQTEPN